MKKLLVALICLLFSSFASSSDYITVTGSGKTFEEAKQQAFRKAIEFKIGATVLSDVETRNYNRDKDEIYIYSAGYVDNYKILKQESSSLGITLLVDVLVSDSKLKNRILSTGVATGSFNGERHSTQISTYLQERQRGDQLLTKVLGNYPSKAFNLKLLPHSIKVDHNRNVFIHVPYELSWNFEFIKSLRETLSLVEDGPGSFRRPKQGAVVIMAKDPKDWIFGSNTQYSFNDLNKVYMVHNAFIRAPKIIIDFKDSLGNYVARACAMPKFVSGYSESFYNIGQQNYIMLYGNTTEKGVISVPASLTDIDKIDKIELRLVAENIC